MKTKLLLAICVFLNWFLYAQSDNCTGTVPTLNVNASCQPTNYSLPTSFADNFSSEPPCGPNYRDGFFQFTATSTITQITLTDGVNSPNPGFMVLSGTCGSTLTVEACAESGNGQTENSIFTTTIGQTYFIVIFSRHQTSNSAPNAAVTGTICVTNYISSNDASASDCGGYVNICSDAGFEIDPNGFGAINEIPASGTFGNPYYDGYWDFNPWGTANYGCLQSGERNSTWMVINVLTAGSLEFTFGGNGTQNGYYDWIMYPFTGSSTCNAISSNNLAPVRCNWNSSNTGGTGLASTLPAGGSTGNFEPPLAVTANTRYIICFSNYSSSTTHVPLLFGGTATVSCTPLSDNIENFIIEEHCESHTSTISWESPLENIQFSLESSTDGKTWKKESLTAEHFTQTLTGKKYSFEDELPENELTYYRIIQELPDESIIHSEIKTARCADTPKSFVLSPNPAESFTQFTYYSNQVGEISIVDMQGRIVQSHILESTGNKITTIDIDVSSLEIGMYTVRYMIGEKNKSTRIVKK